MDYHIAPVADVAQELKSTPAGLDEATAQQRLAEHGPNVLADAKKKTVWQLLLHQLADVMILVLLVAAVVSGAVGEWKSTYVIPADVRFLETHALKVDESSLTGESTNVEKTSDVLPAGNFPLGDRLSMGHKATFVTNGRATAYVVATGMGTERGKIAKLIQTDETVTPLQKRLATLGKYLSAAALLTGALFFGLGWLRGEPLGSLLLVSISLAIAAVPEALHLMILYTPFFNNIFSTPPLTWAELGITVAVSSVVFWAVELQKLICRQREQPVGRLPVVTVGPALPVAAAA